MLNNWWNLYHQDKTFSVNIVSKTNHLALHCKTIALELPLLQPNPVQCTKERINSLMQRALMYGAVPCTTMTSHNCANHIRLESYFEC